MSLTASEIHAGVEQAVLAQLARKGQSGKVSVVREACYPLYPTVPWAAGRNPALYELLVLFDAVRGSSPRERALAMPMQDEGLQG